MHMSMETQGESVGTLGGIWLELVMMKEMDCQVNMSARLRFLGRPPECLTSKTSGHTRTSTSSCQQLSLAT